MDPYEQYLADVEYEQYLQQAQQQSVDNAMGRAIGQPAPTPVIPPFAKKQEVNFGPDYKQGYEEAASKAIDDFLPGLYHMGASLYDYIGSPKSTVATAGLDNNLGYTLGGPAGGFLWQGAQDLGAKAVGSLASGGAGAMGGGAVGATIGGAVGGPLAPITAPIGGAIGAGVGMGAGMGVFDAATNFITGTDKPIDEYLKDFIYNSVLGTATEGTVRGVIGAGKGVAGTAKRAVEPFTTAGAETRVVNDLNRMAPGFADRVAQQLEQRVGDPFLDYKTLPELLDNDVLRNVQRSLSKSGLEGIGQSSAKYRARNDAQLKYLEAIDQSPQTAIDAQSGVKSAIEGELATKQGAIDSATGGVQYLTAKLPQPIDLTEGGSAVRENVAKGLDTQRGIVGQKFAGIGNGIVELTPVREMAGQEMAKYFREIGAEPNGALVDLVTKLEPKLEQSAIIDSATGKFTTKEIPKTIKDVQAARSDAIKIQKTADPRSAAIAGKIIDALDMSVQDAIANGRVTPEEAASWAEGIKARKEQGAVFEAKGLPAKSVLGKEYSGDYTVQDSAVMSKFWKPGKDRAAREAVRNYKRTVEIASGGDSAAVEAAMEPLQRYAVDSFRRAAVDENGLINVKKANAWLEQHSEALKEMPELGRILREPIGAQKFLNEKFGDLKRSKADVEKGALQFWMKDIPPEKAVKEMLSESGKGAAKKTKATVDYLKSKGDKDALGGLRRAVIQHMKDAAYTESGQIPIREASLPNGKPFDGQVSDAALANEWDKIRKPITESGLFSKSQLDSFEYLYKDKQSQMSVDRAKLPGSVTSQDLTVIKALGDMASTGFLKFISPKMGSWISRVLEPVLKKIPAYNYRAIMEDAIFNPRVARDLQVRANARTVAKAASEIFAKQIAEVAGDTTALAVVTNSRVSTPKPTLKKQEQITANKTFPNPSELLQKKNIGDSTTMTKNAETDPNKLLYDAIVAQESSGNKDAVSDKGAIGLMQIMPATARDIADALKVKEYDLRDPATNRRFGEFYIDQQMERFKDPELALTAYHSGPERVAKLLEATGGTTLADIIDYLGPVGQKYARSVLGRIKAA